MKSISTTAAPAAIGPYSQAVICGNMVYTSGQIPVDPASGAISAKDIEGQTEQVCRNIEGLLKAAGSDISKVVKTTCFLADMGHFSAFNEVYARHFTSRPARSCVAVKDIPKGCLVEIEVIAEL